MRIALLGTRGIPASYGGFETFAEEISARLAEAGHEVTVYGRNHHANCSYDSMHGKVRSRIIPTLFHKYLETIIHSFNSFLDCSPDEFDLILLCNAANSPFIPIAMIRGIPVLVNVDGIERKRTKWNQFGKLWYRLGEICSVLFADRIISDAQVIAQYYRSRYRADSEVIAYGAERIFEPAGNMHRSNDLTPKKYLLYVSRLEPENNALGVIQAYLKSSVQMPLVIVGDAPYASEYKQSLREAAMMNRPNARIVFTGFQFGSAYRELREHCYLYIQATQVGGTHPALVEAMAHANCIVANDVEEHREVLSDCGFYYGYNNFENLSEQLDFLCSNPSVVTEFGNKAFMRARSCYGWDKITADYEKLLKSVFDAHNSL